MFFDIDKDREPPAMDNVQRDATELDGLENEGRHDPPSYFWRSL
jgi:hypothetical protein